MILGVGITFIMLGGGGKMSNMVIGVLIIGVLDYGMSFLNINQYWKYVVLGIALLAAVTIDTLQTRAAENAAKKVTGQAPTESQNGTAAK
ncbi:MAG: hypothetical protein PUA87_05100 [Oscillospiraceae bacterium]|nr:hypothetical protein [Oscillospiraceae bacterium]